MFAGGKENRRTQGFVIRNGLGVLLTEIRLAFATMTERRGSFGAEAAVASAIDENRRRNTKAIFGGRAIGQRRL